MAWRIAAKSGARRFGTNGTKRNRMEQCFWCSRADVPKCPKMSPFLRGISDICEYSIKPIIYNGLSDVPSPVRSVLMGHWTSPFRSVRFSRRILRHGVRSLGRNLRRGLFPQIASAPPSCAVDPEARHALCMPRGPSARNGKAERVSSIINTPIILLCFEKISLNQKFIFILSSS